MPLAKFALIFMVTLLLVGCGASSSIKPHNVDAQVTVDTQTTELDQRLRAEAEMFEKSVANSGRLYQNEEITQYFQSILEKLFPDYKDQMRVKLHHSPAFNAFALPNGSIYINLGMLASLRNEAQIASILAHEGTHYIYRHSEKQRHKVNNSVGVSLILNSFGGLGSLISLGVLSSISGYSQSMEYEADSRGFKYLIEAGYQGRQAEEAFKILSAEVKEHDYKSGGLFSSHPKLERRIKNFNNLCKAPSNDCDQGVIGVEAYRVVSNDIRDVAFASKLESGKYSEVISNFSDHESCLECDSAGFYYLVEAYRRRGREGDLEKALGVLERYTKNGSQDSRAFHSYGLIFMKKGMKEEAIRNFKKHLQTTDGSDEEMIAFSNYYLKKLDI
ncbi:MAG: M48 family metallopeptidase [Cellvibrionaceae bacterium]